MTKNILHLILLFSIYLLSASFTGHKTDHEVSAIYISENPSKVTEISAKELQKYIYLRSSKLVSIKTYINDVDIQSSIILFNNITNLKKEESEIETKGSNLYIQGGSDIGLLYGVYHYAELLGVQFTLDRDVIPDKLYEGSLLNIKTKKYSPLFSVRGMLPFHDFPEGPDLWDTDMYKSYITQMVKMKLNFFSLHTYPNIEPNVWVGLEEDIEDNGDVKYSYPSTLANTSRPGAWGYSAMDTREYSCGSSSLFTDSVYASPLIEGVLPYPKSQEENNLVFNRTGKLFNDAFTFGKKFEMDFCMGLESPISIPREVRARLEEKSIDPNSDEAKALVYEGVFSRIEKTHPLDYFWLWTPEGWTWGTPTKESVENTKNDIEIARNVLEKRSNPFGFGLSGWVLGPPDNPTLFDKYLPEGDFMSSLSRLVGQERLDLDYRDLKGKRSTMPILWLEDDPAMTTPQFWAGRLRNDIAEAYSNESKGVIGIHWRTRSIDTNIQAFAKACWEQEEWNPNWNKQYNYAPVAINDIRMGGVGANYYKGIIGTEDQYLYNTQRYGIDGYKVKVPNGNYRVTFLFSETKFSKENERVFDIKIEGKDVVTNLDVFKESGSNNAFAFTSDEFVIDDYSLDIEFASVIGETFLSGLIIEGKTADANQIKGTEYKRAINTGGGLYKDFEADLSEQVGNRPSIPRDMSSVSLYKDFALNEFGEEVADEVASIFQQLDGTIGEDGHTGFKMPRPAAWITGPGVIQVNEKSWAEESANYDFVDKLIALQSKVKGVGNNDRFRYWVNTFSYLRAMAKVGCIRGELDRNIKDM